uniref:Uncharacterized protein n=1 Tax=Opuntia streptacantha TaxID=393608 RepID=A0A7C9E2H9_OPUST
MLMLCIVMLWSSDLFWEIGLKSSMQCPFSLFYCHFSVQVCLCNGFVSHRKPPRPKQRQAARNLAEFLGGMLVNRTMFLWLTKAVNDVLVLNIMREIGMNTLHSPHCYFLTKCVFYSGI